MKVKRGDIYLADLSDANGSEQGKVRPVVVIQNNRGNKYSPTTIVACLSSKVNSKHHLPTHYLLPEGLGLKYKSMVMCEQIRVLDKSRLIKKITKLDKRHMMHIDRRIKISLDLKQQHLHSRK
ncbi:type II toxin-antitoxin system PemK/MazF family toxin [Holdemanella sp.]|uniref:type II toxin-antitoxin system PemK/MazF family toxin n=1 Tax=Holdemanella sp. TaxID=1971762 RepID=UPI00307AB480